mmetsp:Transcript_60960/g.125621  ORF Transcript_60960/g.125621 Transcript_60960/m.125621 type:complete len:209 (-) Transcript_60960:5510-6136(-)
MLAVSMFWIGVLSRRLLAMFVSIRSLDISEASPALPTMMSTSATSLRSVFAVTRSQKTLTPPLTTGMEAERVVFICKEPSSVEIRSFTMAVTTRCTKTLLLRVESAGGSQPKPNGMLNDTNWSGFDDGSMHIAAFGAQGWLRRVLKRVTSSKLSCVYSKQACRIVFCVVKDDWKSPLLTRTESSGMREPSIGWYCGPIVNVTWTYWAC